MLWLLRGVIPGTSTLGPWVFSINAFLLKFAVLLWDHGGCPRQGSGHFPSGTNCFDLPDAAAAGAFFWLWAGVGVYSGSISLMVAMACQHLPQSSLV